MRLLVTGATGYLGQHLIDSLDRHEIVCPCVPGTEAALAGRGNIMAVNVDDPQFNERVSAFSAELAINIAGVYDNMPLDKVVFGNLVFPLKLLDLLADQGLKKWININTALPRALSPYSLAKHQFGDWGAFYSGKAGISFMDIQLEQFYGANDGRFISFVIRKLLANEPLELTECTQRRDIIHVDDVCAGIVRLMDAELPGYTSIPLGTGEAPMIKEIVEYSRALTGSGSDIRYGAVEMRAGEPMLSVADTATMLGLGIRAKLDWKAGVKKAIEEMRK